MNCTHRFRYDSIFNVYDLYIITHPKADSPQVAFINEFFPVFYDSIAKAANVTIHAMTPAYLLCKNKFGKKKLFFSIMPTC